MTTSSAERPWTHVPWRLRDMFWACVVALGLIMGGLILAVGVAYLWPGLDLSSSSPSTLALVIFALEAVLIVPAWTRGPRRYGGGWSSLGLRRFAPLRSLVLFLVGLAVVLIISPLWEVVRRQLGLAGQPSYLPLFGEGPWGLVLALLLGGIVAPFAEEVFFRGYLYAGLRELWGRGWALFVSSLAFAALHFTPGVLPPIFLIGLILAYIYERADSLWPSIALHSAINTIAFVGAYLVERFPHLVSGSG